MPPNLIFSATLVVVFNSFHITNFKITLGTCCLLGTDISLCLLYDFLLFILQIARILTGVYRPSKGCFATARTLHNEKFMFIRKLDREGPVDNSPSIDLICYFVKKTKKTDN